MCLGSGESHATLRIIGLSQCYRWERDHEPLVPEYEINMHTDLE